MKRKHVGMALALAGMMTVQTISGAMAATTSPEMSEREMRNDELSCLVATEGIVLLENRGNALPLSKEGKIALYGEGAYATYASSIGNAWVKTRNEFVNVYQGFLNAGYDVVTSDYVESYGAYYEENKTGGRVGSPYVIPDALPITEDDAKAAAAEADTAVYVITRSTAE